MAGEDHAVTPPAMQATAEKSSVIPEPAENDKEK
jgi:hypothetical protein